MMKNQYFSYREKCPACNAKTLKEHYRKPYDKPPISEYLKSFYPPPGCVEFEYLENATYHLCECKECGLIFQKEISNDFLMKLLYEKWLNPNKTFNHHKKQMI